MNAINQLSKSELKVAHLVSNGLNEQQIADKLFNSKHTIHAHKKTIYKKWGAKNIADVTRIFILSLPKASDVLKATLFLALQMHLIFNVTGAELRKPTRTRIATRIVRVKTKK